MMNDIPKILNYNDFVSDALTLVVRKSLLCIAKYGFQGEHHFYITFLSNAEGVEIPDFLLQKYPKEMTIVIQHQFFDLQVFVNYFQVSLSFNKQLCRLTIPFNAITSFMDPAVNFRLILHPIKSPPSEDSNQSIDELDKNDSLVHFTPRARTKEYFKDEIADFKTKRAPKKSGNNIIKLHNKRPKDD